MGGGACLSSSDVRVVVGGGEVSPSSQHVSPTAQQASGSIPLIPARIPHSPARIRIRQYSPQSSTYHAVPLPLSPACVPHSPARIPHRPACTMRAVCACVHAYLAGKLRGPSCTAQQRCPPLAESAAPAPQQCTHACASLPAVLCHMEHAQKHACREKHACTRRGHHRAAAYTLRSSMAAAAA